MRFILPYLCLLSISAVSRLHFNKLDFLHYGIHGAPPLMCYDSDHNGKGELIFTALGTGSLGQTQRIMMIYEYYNGYGHSYPFYPVYADSGPTFQMLGIGDFDKDGCTDIIGDRGSAIYPDSCFRSQPELTLYESPDFNSYPTVLSPWYDTISSGSIGTPGDLDGDGREEIVVVSPIFCNSGMYRATDTFIVYENRGDNQYERAFIHPLIHPLPPDLFGKPVFGDFDQDGKMELIMGSIGGIIVIYENTGDDKYEEVWQDSSLDLSMMDMFSSKDTDGDGKPEFFATLYRDLYSGVFYLFKWEAIGDNIYKSTFIDTASFKRLTGPTVMSKCGDLDKDGLEEIVWATGRQVYVYKAVGDDKYERVWEWENNHTAHVKGVTIVGIYDFNENGYPEIIISGHNKTSIFEIDTTYGIASKPSISKSSNLTISPNPCKGVASIEYQVASREPISLEVYDATGRLVRILTEAQSPEPKAYTTVWDGQDDKGEEAPQGIYFIQLRTENKSLTRKVVLVK